MVNHHHSPFYYKRIHSCMSKKNKFLFIFNLLFLNTSFSQPVKEYFSYISRAEDFIISNQLDSSIKYYDLAFTKFNTPFVLELFQATFISSYLPDKSLFYSYLEKCLLRGMNRPELLLFKDRFNEDPNYTKFVKGFDEYRTKYLLNIDSTIYSSFLEVDIFDQIKNQEVDRIPKQPFEKYQYGVSKKLYIDLVQSYGWPLENKIGIGNAVGLHYTKNVLQSKKNYGNTLIRQIDSPLLTENGKVSVFVLSNPGEYTSFLYQTNRIGNTFLWHYLPYVDSLFNSFVFNEGVLNLNVHPRFFAQAEEINSVLNEKSSNTSKDMLLGAGSYYFKNTLKYDAFSKYKLPHSISSIYDERRMQRFIRTLHKEKLLILSIINLINNQNLTDFSKKDLKKNEKFIAIFVNKNVG